jgi:hypothetical protein
VHESEIIYIYKMSLSYKKHSKNAIMPMCKYRQNQTLHYLKKNYTRTNSKFYDEKFELCATVDQMSALGF